MATPPDHENNVAQAQPGMCDGAFELVRRNSARQKKISRESSTRSLVENSDGRPATSPQSSTTEVEGAAPQEDDSPTGCKLAILVAVLSLLMILTGLDSTIVATATPAMTRSFGTIADIGWYTVVYRLTSSSFQFIFSKTYGIFPPKPILLASLAVFATGNLLCAVASISAIFVMGQAVTGLATAGLITGAFAIITRNFPLRKRSIYGGSAGAIEQVAALSAPLLGGYVMDRLTWHWCFYILLFPTMLAFILVASLMELPRNREGTDQVVSIGTKLQQLDLLGTALFVPSMLALLLALQWGGIPYAWSNCRIVLSLVFFALLFIAFVWLQRRRQDNATIPPHILLQRSSLFGCLFSFCTNAALSIISIYLPIYFQTVKLLPASTSGLITLPSIASFSISLFFSGFLTSIIGYYTPLMLLASIITPVAAGLLTTLTSTASTSSLVGYQLLLGLGAGISIQGPQVAVQTILPPVDALQGIAVIQFAQGIGPAVFVAVAQSIFAARLAVNVGIYAPDSKGLGEGGLMGAGAGAGARSTPTTGSGNNNTQGLGAILSYDKALTETFYLPVVLCCLTLLGAAGMEWRSVKEKRS